MDFASMYMNPTWKPSRVDYSHILESYFKFLKTHKKEETERVGEKFEKHEDK